LDLFFDKVTSSNCFKVHFFSPTYFKHPTIDLTCCCKNDFETNNISILFFIFFTFTFSKVLIGELAEHEEDLKVEKSLVPTNICELFLINSMSNFFLIFHALFFLTLKKLLYLLLYIYKPFFLRYASHENYYFFFLH